MIHSADASTLAWAFTGFQETDAPPKGSRYYPAGTVFVKMVKGLPGDRLETREDHTVWLNGARLDSIRATDSTGRRVEPFRFEGVIPEHAYFLYSAAPNSCDSRYYGLIEEDDIIGRVVPLL